MPTKAGSIALMNDLSIGGAALGPSSLSVAAMARLPGVATVDGVADHAIGDAVPVSEVVQLAKPSTSATHCTVVSADGAYSASIPIRELVEDGWLAFRLNGDALPAENGGPLRLTVARGRTLCWNVKNVGELRFTVGTEPDSVPARPTH